MANAEPTKATNGHEPQATSAPALVACTGALVQERVALLLDHLQLLQLQARYALASLQHLLLCALMLAVTLISAWLALLVGSVLWLMEQGLATSSAVLMAVPLSLLAVALCRLAMPAGRDERPPRADKEG